MPAVAVLCFLLSDSHATMVGMGWDGTNGRREHGHLKLVTTPLSWAFLGLCDYVLDVLTHLFAVCTFAWRLPSQMCADMELACLSSSKLPSFLWKEEEENHVCPIQIGHNGVRDIKGPWKMTPALVVCFRWNSNRAFLYNLYKILWKICMIQQIIC